MPNLKALPALLSAIDADEVSTWWDLLPLVEHPDRGVSGLADDLLSLSEALDQSGGFIDAEQARRCGWRSLTPLLDAGILATLDDSAPRWFVEFADLRAVLEAA